MALLDVYEPLTLAAPPKPACAWVYDPKRLARGDNGESFVYDLLCWEADSLGEPRPLYEPWKLELVDNTPFVPDFWRPGLFVEVTQLDLFVQHWQQRLDSVWPSDRPKQHRWLTRMLNNTVRRWEQKQSKVEEARRLHGVRIELITGERLRELKADPDQAICLAAANF